jgi:hypothetical protein
MPGLIRAFDTSEDGRSLSMVIRLGHGKERISCNSAGAFWNGERVVWTSVEISRA